MQRGREQLCLPAVHHPPRPGPSSAFHRRLRQEPPPAGLCRDSNCSPAPTVTFSLFPQPHSATVPFPKPPQCHCPSRASPGFAVLAWLHRLQLRILPGRAPVSGLSFLSLSLSPPLSLSPSRPRAPQKEGGSLLLFLSRTAPKLSRGLSSFHRSPVPGWEPWFSPGSPPHLLCASCSLSKGAFCFIFPSFFFFIKYFRAFLFFPLKKTTKQPKKKIVFCKTCVQALLLLETLGEIVICVDLVGLFHFFSSLFGFYPIPNNNKLLLRCLLVFEL